MLVGREEREEEEEGLEMTASRADVKLRQESTELTDTLSPLLYPTVVGVWEI